MNEKWGKTLLFSDLYHWLKRSSYTWGGRQRNRMLLATSKSFILCIDDHIGTHQTQLVRLSSALPDLVQGFELMLTFALLIKLNVSWLKISWLFQARVKKVFLLWLKSTMWIQIIYHKLYGWELIGFYQYQCCYRLFLLAKFFINSLIDSWAIFCLEKK